ncbi:MAG: hypothetical protein UZ18_ATM001001573, partial [Armatimonadetes bacterium OLB18]
MLATFEPTMPAAPKRANRASGQGPSIG